MVALAILIFIALRAARVTNESDGNMAAKILTSIFGVFVAFFSLQLADGEYYLIQILLQG